MCVLRTGNRVYAYISRASRVRPTFYAMHDNAASHRTGSGAPSWDAEPVRGFPLLEPADLSRAEQSAPLTEIVTRAKEDGKDSTKWFRARGKNGSGIPIRQ